MNKFLAISRIIPDFCSTQGGILSPLLWNLVLNDIPHLGQHTSFCRRCKSFKSGKTQYGIINNTQNILNKIIKWCKQNDLQICTLKTKVVYWYKTKTNNHSKYIEIYGQKSEISNSVKYLGIIIDDQLNWNEHIQVTIKTNA